jgi:beta-galactosidase
LNEGKQAESAKVTWQILDASGKVVAIAVTSEQSVPIDVPTSFSTTVRLENPALWSVDEPNLYSAIVTVSSRSAARDGERIQFGVRTAEFTAAKGFFLNGKPMKIQGTCNHQDHAGVGAALPDRLQAYRIGVLKAMGCNSVRTSHNMPTPEWVEACDRLGMTMMCETRQMSSNPEGLAQLETMIKRYRNSPSIIIWSIGNEEFILQDAMAEEGAKVAETMVRRCHELDPTRVVSAAVNGSNEKGVSLPLDIIGFNYNLKFPDAYHNQNTAKKI